VERQAAQVMTRTADGKRVEVFANLVSTEDTQLALDNGAEGIGLLRTEFLFQDRLTPPSETEQSRLYTDVLRAFGQRKVLIRTLDIGGDKPAPYLPLPAENNPFLGWRAIRISLAMPEFFKTQMRALLRAAMYGNLHIMLPMITRVTEVEQARALMMAAAEELDESSTTHRANVPLGIMVEVPAAVQILDQLARHVDFFSLGTNDLAQYTFAADRTNRRVAPLADTLHPAILRQIDQVVRMAHAAGKWVGICGEMAGHPDAVPLLLGLGIDEFSVAPAGIPQVKKAIGSLTTPACRQLAQQALTLPDAESVRKLVRLWKE
jgi:phosphocarrier protein FPr